MTSPITNCFDGGFAPGSVEVETAWLYRPEDGWTYSHHPSVTYFKGRFCAVWSNGRRDEDAPGQRVLMSTSADFHHWSEPVPVIDSQMGEHSEAVLTAAGFHRHAGRLIVYAGRYEYARESLADGRRLASGEVQHTGTTLIATVTADGETFAETVDLRLPLVPNHGPQPTASGRLIVSGNVMHPYTDDPGGLAGWRPGGIYPQGLDFPLVDDSASFRRIARAAGWEVCPCEGSFFQTDDGVIHMLHRTGAGVLWATASDDDGETWSAPEPTRFTDNGTKFHFGRLPDGRFYYVGCPHAEPPGARFPLVLSLSQDGVRFDRHYVIGAERHVRQHEGMYKGGDYGYPHTMVHDGWLAVIVSRCKEAVQVRRVRLDNL
jgi:hypothetical protein